MFQFRSRKYVLLASAAAIFGMGACVSAPPELPQSGQNIFAGVQPVSINVSSVNVHMRTAGTGGDFIADPAAVAEDYVKARFTPRGMANSLEVTIEEATVTRATQEGGTKVEKFFGVGGADVYNITLKVRFDYVESTGRLIYGKVFTARRQMSISEHASVAEREQLEIEGLKKMFGQIDEALQNTVMQEMNLGVY